MNEEDDSMRGPLKGQQHSKHEARERDLSNLHFSSNYIGVLYLDDNFVKEF